MKVLCVAEKPSIAKAIAGILGDQFVTRQTGNQYIKNYDTRFQSQRWGDCNMTITSVVGHITETDFPESHRPWNSCSPDALFDVPIRTLPRDAVRPIHANLATEARHAQILFIWTDCDREGEYIGWEVLMAARKGNANIDVKRANFNNLERAHIIQAALNPGLLDMNQVNAVAARMELDLRTGAAFTRLQTTQLQSIHPLLEKVILSYGSCQFPTLGFIVDRWRKVTNFRPEQYWAIKVTLSRDNIDVAFRWQRSVLYDRLAVVVLFQQVLEGQRARIASVQQKPKSKWRPLPLTTVEMQKQGTRFLHLSAHQIMDHAEKLYQKGFVSYPRTETDQFDPGMDLRTLVAKQTTDEAWGEYARGLLEGGRFRQPRAGPHNDKAHPPIHPIAHVTRGACASMEEHKVYTLITRRFLAACSEDAKGSQSTVDIEMGGERFSASGLTVLERNYLDVYPYDRWESSAQLPAFRQGELVEPKSVEMTNDKTTRPSFLSEPELIGLMDANGIGTDATMAAHIEKVLERQYTLKEANGGTPQFIPTTLGIALVEGFDAMGFEESLTKPQLRKETERQLAMIHRGEANKADVLATLTDQYRMAFLRVKGNIQVLKQAVLRELPR
ncbi:DNA topoisomerase [Protomyces lactucae-debilis]|uniref:DNA topoisomerase n=1 Tax=Protomyces lactucae-debilis TaxID=2754530 RepID=A0A1Y2FDR0_PROLT|nr:DNA topoisomerase [Protomyces lactucae-debilis]ORY82060.1 DNA topoisomerase [Protomyces lactucae-debilis]